MKLAVNESNAYVEMARMLVIKTMDIAEQKDIEGKVTIKTKISIDPNSVYVKSMSKLDAIMNSLFSPTAGRNTVSVIFKDDEKTKARLCNSLDRYPADTIVLTPRCNANMVGRDLDLTTFTINADIDVKLEVKMIRQITRKLQYGLQISEGMEEREVKYLKPRPMTNPAPVRETEESINIPKRVAVPLECYSTGDGETMEAYRILFGDSVQTYRIEEIRNCGGYTLSNAWIVRKQRGEEPFTVSRNFFKEDVFSFEVYPGLCSLGAAPTDNNWMFVKVIEYIGKWSKDNNILSFACVDVCCVPFVLRVYLTKSTTEQYAQEIEKIKKEEIVANDVYLFIFKPRVDLSWRHKFKQDRKGSCFFPSYLLPVPGIRLVDADIGLVHINTYEQLYVEPKTTIDNNIITWINEMKKGQTYGEAQEGRFNYTFPVSISTKQWAFTSLDHVLMYELFESPLDMLIYVGKVVHEGETELSNADKTTKKSVSLYGRIETGTEVKLNIREKSCLRLNDVYSYWSTNIPCICYAYNIRVRIFRKSDKNEFVQVKGCWTEKENRTQTVESAFDIELFDHVHEFERVKRFWNPQHVNKAGEEKMFLTLDYIPGVSCISSVKLDADVGSYPNPKGIGYYVYPFHKAIEEANARPDLGDIMFKVSKMNNTDAMILDSYAALVMIKDKKKANPEYKTIVTDGYSHSVLVNNRDERYAVPGYIEIVEVRVHNRWTYLNLCKSVKECVTVKGAVEKVLHHLGIRCVTCGTVGEYNYATGIIECRTEQCERSKIRVENIHDMRMLIECQGSFDVSMTKRTGVSAEGGNITVSTSFIVSRYIEYYTEYIVNMNKTEFRMEDVRVIRIDIGAVKLAFSFILLDEVIYVAEHIKTYLNQHAITEEEYSKHSFSELKETFVDTLFEIKMNELRTRLDDKLKTVKSAISEQFKLAGDAHVELMVVSISLSEVNERNERNERAPAFGERRAEDKLNHYYEVHEFTGTERV